MIIIEAEEVYVCCEFYISSVVSLYVVSEVPEICNEHVMNGPLI